MAVPERTSVRAEEHNWGRRFLDAVRSTQPVAGFAHHYYRYPTRFSPLFARAVIEAFTQPGDVVLDPFMGGGTTLVEAIALGRHSLGCDINSLAVFLAKVKTTILNNDDLTRIANWVCELPARLILRRPARAGCDVASATSKRLL